jgi:hypothetical protein
MPLTASRCDILWLSGRVKKPTSCVVPVISVDVLEKCCDICGDGITISDRVLRRMKMPLFEWQLLPFTGVGLDMRQLSGRGRTPTFCVFHVFSVAAMEKRCHASGNGEYYFRCDSLVSAEASI